MGFQLRTATRTDPGLHRPNNEDSLYAGQRLLVVADGVGGAPAGEVASEIVVKALTPLDSTAPPADPVATLREAVERANRHLADVTGSDPARRGMGTTVTAMLLTDEALALLHVGDSRAYRWRGGELARLTVDDTYVQWLVAEGVLTPEQAREHPQRSVVTQAVQGEPLSPALDLLTPQTGDRYLLCSDGLSDAVPDDAIAPVLADHPDLAGCAERLIQLALAAGGPDNISVVLAEVIEASRTIDG
ncbi:MAG TPA: PP2C family serine/threonine-protein phosphatase [Micromonosporaceae bacterium]